MKKIYSRLNVNYQRESYSFNRNMKYVNMIFIFILKKRTRVCQCRPIIFILRKFNKTNKTLRAVMLTTIERREKKKKKEEKKKKKNVNVNCLLFKALLCKRVILFFFLFSWQSWNKLPQQN